jgi:hypothetical protein
MDQGLSVVDLGWQVEAPQVTDFPSLTMENVLRHRGYAAKPGFDMRVYRRVTSSRFGGRY